MTVILVLALFVTCMIVERITNKKAPEYVLQPAPEASGLRKLVPIVAGFALPEHLRLHPGHAWALDESPKLVRTGIDDFAAKLIGKPEEVILPARGQWIRQGQKAYAFRLKNGELVEMVSPIEGTVADINDEVVRHPEMLTADPYGHSWLMTVESPDAKTNFRNLLTGPMARNLMSLSAKRLASYIPESVASPALAQDGGMAHGEIAKMIPAEKHAEIAKEFFLAA